MGPIGRRHRRRVPEHVCKCIARINLPLTNILIKYSCSFEHIVKVRARRHIPTTDVLIKCGRLIEHISKITATRHVPTTDVLVEAVCDVEYPIEAGHIPHIPLRNILIKGLRILEHPIERESVAHIPLRNVTIEGGFVQKRMGEIGDIAHIPIGHDRVTGAGGIVDTKPRHRFLGQTIVDNAFDRRIADEINRHIQRIDLLGYPIRSRHNDWNGLNHAQGCGDRYGVPHIALRIRDQDGATVNGHRRIGMADIVKFRWAHLNINTAAVWNPDVVSVCRA